MTNNDNKPVNGQQEQPGHAEGQQAFAPSPISLKAEENDAEQKREEGTTPEKGEESNTPEKGEEGKTEIDDVN